MNRLSAFFAALSLAACDIAPRLKPDAALLAGMGSAPSQGPDCSGCHSYPLHDVNHTYHLMAANVNRNNLGFPELNAITTCMDCHFNSIRHFSYVHSDTTWVDSNGVELLEHTLPSDRVGSIASYRRWRPLPYGGADTLRREDLATEIDSAVFRQALLGRMLEWMTSYAHFDGKVDVSFPPNNVSDPGALAAAYRPKDISCSSIACHNSPKVGYRWRDPSAGFSNCPSLTGQDSTCLNEVSP